jgi:site-specific DNA recombinase
VSGLLGRRHVQAAACRTSFTNRVATSSQTSKLSRPPRLTIQPTLQRPFGVQLWRASSSRSGKAKQRPEPTQTRASAFAIYARVSTEDQAERETIQSQLGFLREFVNLHGPPVAGEYVDDGISGTVPLAERPEGQRLAIDAEVGRFGVVLVYRIDRLGRSLRSLLNAHDTLSDCSVAIRSATECFDTSSPIGSFLFQLLASLAELEKSTISERTSRGRDRVNAHGKWTCGPIPYGYDLDDKGHLIPSERRVDTRGVTEAELVADIFTRIARGEATINSEYQRLNTLGIPREMRYGGEKARVRVNPRGWQFSLLHQLLHNPIYTREGVLDSRFGQVTCPAPALVDGATWEAAQAALLRNRTLATRNAKRDYPPRGLIRCQNCGHSYSGAYFANQRRYRCWGGTRTHPGSDGQPQRCFGKHLPTEWIEDAVWQECRQFILNPGDALKEARR